MNRWVKRVGLGFGAVVAVVLLGGGSYVAAKSAAFDESIAKVYAVPPIAVQRSTDPAVLARGKHLVEATAACASADCHGGDLGGGKPLAMGPVGTFVGPNLTPGGVVDSYSDGELARVVRHGLKRDGTTVRFMPSQDFSWLPDADLAAIVSYLRSVPAVRRDNPATEVGVLGKVLDQRDQFVVDVARRIDHYAKGDGTPAEPTPAYGKLLARLCQGCHGEHLSGGPIPGAPPSTPVPTNLTPDATGLAGWAYADFDRLLVQGVRKNGAKLDPFMPIEAFGRMNETEKRALFEYLRTLEPRPFGGR